MRVLIVSNFAPTQSSQNIGIFIKKRLEYLQNLGVECTVVYPHRIGLEWMRKLLKGTIIKIRSGEIVFTGMEEEWNLFDAIFEKIFNVNTYEKYVIRFAKKIVRSFDVQSFDIIHAHGMYDLPAGMIAEYVSEMTGKPFVVTLHGSDVNFSMKRRKGRYVRTLEKASKVIFVSKALLERAKSYGYSGKNAVVIPNGYDPNLFFPRDKERIRKELGIYKEGGRYVGFVGVLSRVKGADLLPKIFKKVSERVPNITFIVVGDGKLMKKLKRELKSINVIFTGRIPHEEVPLWMNAMDVMILPSRNEGWPCVVFEALACRTCVIGSDAGGIPEAIGNSSYIVSRKGAFIEEFSRKVSTILSDGSEMCLSESNNAKDFTWSDIVRNIYKIYEEVAEKR